MKKLIFVSLIGINLILRLNGQVQWDGIKPGNIYYNQGNVGIGTASPASPLTINRSTNHLVPSFLIDQSPTNPGCDGCINIAQKINVLDNQGLYKTNIGLWIKSSGASRNYAAIFENGSVGIGTTSPAALLHINNGNNSDAAILATSENSKLVVSSVASWPANSETFRISHAWDNNRNNGYISFYRGPDVNGGFLAFGTNGTERMRCDYNGYVGIGTNSPMYRTHISDLNPDNSAFKSLLALEGNVSAESANNSFDETRPSLGIVFKRDWTSFGTPKTMAGIFAWGSYNWAGGLAFTTASAYSNGVQSTRMVITDLGNVGIGTTSPGDYRLNVSGKIRANEIVVNTTGADFVFEPDHKLKDLSSVEKFIKENKHLPDIPSAKEMQENGMNMSEIQTKMLQKIEELTLYIIELKKENDIQSNVISRLTECIESLSKEP